MGVVDSLGILLSEANHRVIHSSKLRQTTGELDVLYHLYVGLFAFLKDPTIVLPR